MSRFSYSLTPNIFHHFVPDQPITLKVLRNCKALIRRFANVLRLAINSRERRVLSSTDSVRVDHHHLIDAASPMSAQIRWMWIWSAQGEVKVSNSFVRDFVLMLSVLQSSYVRQWTSHTFSYCALRNGSVMYAVKTNESGRVSMFRMFIILPPLYDAHELISA